MNQKLKETINAALVMLLVFGVLLFINWAISTMVENTLVNQPNCWEERIEGVNKQTGNKAYYSDNFNCKDFIKK
jgi:hypothetical protein